MLESLFLPKRAQGNPEGLSFNYDIGRLGHGLTCPLCRCLSLNYSHQTLAYLQARARHEQWSDICRAVQETLAAADAKEISKDGDYHWDWEDDGDSDEEVFQDEPSVDQKVRGTLAYTGQDNDQGLGHVIEMTPARIPTMHKIRRLHKSYSALKPQEEDEQNQHHGDDPLAPQVV